MAAFDPTQQTGQQPFPLSNDVGTDIVESEENAGSQEGDILDIKNMKKNADGNYYCPWEDCEHKESRRTELRKHLKKHVKPNTCHICGKDTAERRDLQRHILSHHTPSKDKKKYTCSICNQTFTRDDNLKKHQTNMHS
ncbi:uncharacterized protein BCR38DRAFT_521390 [Pseudomassariella vexata]|uniref:C2H2-type domain-containing protein n=1 Tax=Pseudomassariella vexata TaxID=1141098 RepID=A0A1Y2E9T1_9PEZI|nr:uncharacterized protein BCR38DRAFT_521390 [Pseudomassariella vexata]ORY68302.1 hypothetical protein BCR38DRAFT_521390 [Pseudomassariella vexata]